MWIRKDCFLRSTNQRTGFASDAFWKTLLSWCRRRHNSSARYSLVAWRTVDDIELQEPLRDSHAAKRKTRRYTNKLHGATFSETYSFPPARSNACVTIRMFLRLSFHVFFLLVLSDKCFAYDFSVSNYYIEEGNRVKVGLSLPSDWTTNVVSYDIIPNESMEINSGMCETEACPSWKHNCKITEFANTCTSWEDSTCVDNLWNPGTGSTSSFPACRNEYYVQQSYSSLHIWCEKAYHTSGGKKYCRVFLGVNYFNQPPPPPPSQLPPPPPNYNSSSPNSSSPGSSPGSSSSNKLDLQTGIVLYRYLEPTGSGCAASNTACSCSIEYTVLKISSTKYQFTSNFNPSSEPSCVSGYQCYVLEIEGTLNDDGSVLSGSAKIGSQDAGVASFARVAGTDTYKTFVGSCTYTYSTTKPLTTSAANTVSISPLFIMFAAALNVLVASRTWVREVSSLSFPWTWVREVSSLSFPS